MYWKTAREPWSLATRLTVWYAGAVMTLLVAAVAALHLSLALDSERSLGESVEPAVARLHANREAILRLVQSAPEEQPLRVVSPEGEVVYEAKALARDFPALSFPPPGGRKDLTTPVGGPFTLFTRQQGGWTYQLVVNRSDERRFLVQVYRNLALIAVPLFAAALLAGHLLARAGLHPLRRVAAEMGAVSADRLDRRVSIDAPTLPRELATVAGSFNQVMDRLAAAVARLDQFAADVAHELRTPVHYLRTAAELALQADRPAEQQRQVLGGMVDEADRLTRLIDRLLLLARLSNPRAGLVREPADLAAELADIRDFFEPAATEAGVVVAVVATPGLTYPLDRALLQRAVSNLVANAVAHTPPGGRVELRADALPAGLTVEVRDTGHGIPAAALPHLFDRFYRLGQPGGEGKMETTPPRTPPARGRPAGQGLGLGLAIVKRVVELHGGSAAISSEVERGTTVRLMFPESGTR